MFLIIKKQPAGQKRPADCIKGFMCVRRLFPQCSIEEGNDLGAGAGVTGAERGDGSAAGHALSPTKSAARAQIAVILSRYGQKTAQSSKRKAAPKGAAFRISPRSH